MVYPSLQLADNEIFLYHHSDGFTEQHLNAVLVVDQAYSYYAQIKYHRYRQGKFVAHAHCFADALPPAVVQAIKALLTQPGFLQLAPRYTAGWDDLGARFVVGKTAGGINRIEIEEPFGRQIKGFDNGLATTEAEVALLDVRAACDALIRQLYASVAVSPPPRSK